MNRKKNTFQVLGYKNQYSFYASPKWKKLKTYKLSINPLCEVCQEKGLIVPATEVDHIKELRYFPYLGLTLSNLRSLCKPCHSSKTATKQAQANKGGRLLTKYNFNHKNLK